MLRRCVGPDGAAVSGHPGIRPVEECVAVEHLSPRPWPRHAHPVANLGGFVQARDDDDNVASGSFEPAVEGDDVLRAVDVVGVDRLATQRRLVPAGPEQFADEAQEGGGRVLAGFEGVPGDGVADGPDVVGPWSRFQDLFPHEQHRVPGAVSRIPVTTRERLAAYHDAGSPGSPGAGVRGPRSNRTSSWLSM